MTDHEQIVAGGMPPIKKGRSTILIALGAVLAVSCLACGVASYFLGRPGKPVPPTAFIDDDTRGIVVVQVDLNRDGVRKLTRAVARQMQSYNANKGELREADIYDYLQSNQEVPRFTLIGSYKGEAAEDVRRFGVVVYSELQGHYRLYLDKMFFPQLAKAIEAPQYGGTTIMEGMSLIEHAQREGAFGAEGEIEDLRDLSTMQFSVLRSCLLLGSTVDDVKAAIDTLNRPDMNLDADSPLMEVYRGVDKNTLIYGALLNQNDSLLAAINGGTDGLEDLREEIQSVAGFDPRQVQAIAFSFDILSEDEAEIKLNVRTANDTVAQQVKAFIDALEVQNTYDDIPLTFTATTSEVDAGSYIGVIRINGLDQMISDSLNTYSDEFEARQQMFGEGEGEQAWPDDATQAPEALIDGQPEDATQE